MDYKISIVDVNQQLIDDTNFGSINNDREEIDIENEPFKNSFKNEIKIEPVETLTITKDNR